MTNLSLPLLKSEAKAFSHSLTTSVIKDLYGTTDGKAVGTYVEQQFRTALKAKYSFTEGNSASGIDFPGDSIQVDLKVTSIRQPQSSCPFRNASQKVYGLGYHLLIMVYEKTDDPVLEATRLAINHVVFVAKERTADYQTTFGIHEILRRNGNVDDIVAFLEERRLPLDEIGREALANRILENPPNVGYLTISNALQWRLQYRRVIEQANHITGLEDLLG